MHCLSLTQGTSPSLLPGHCKQKKTWVLCLGGLGMMSSEKEESVSISPAPLPSQSQLREKYRRQTDGDQMLRKTEEDV